jgi:hypothetical protein
MKESFERGHKRKKKKKETTYQTMAPRIQGGAVSAWYMGTSSDKAPTPRPATNLPIMTWYQADTAAIWMTKPTEVTRHQKLMEGRRPTLSAIGAATRAPIKVPMERRATMRPERTVLK